MYKWWWLGLSQQFTLSTYHQYVGLNSTIFADLDIARCVYMSVCLHKNATNIAKTNSSVFSTIMRLGHSVFPQCLSQLNRNNNYAETCFAVISGRAASVRVRLPIYCWFIIISCLNFPTCQAHDLSVLYKCILASCVPPISSAFPHLVWAYLSARHLPPCAIWSAFQKPTCVCYLPLLTSIYDFYACFPHLGPPALHESSQHQRARKWWGRTHAALFPDLSPDNLRG